MAPQYQSDTLTTRYGCENIVAQPEAPSRELLQEGASLSKPS